MVVQHYENNMTLIFSLQRLTRSPRGYVALFSVIVLGAIGTAIMVSVIASGVSSSQTDFSLQQSGMARMMASSCAEEALQVVLETGTTSKTANLSIASGTCSYIISPQAGQSLEIRATGGIGTVISKIKILVATTTPALILSSWEEVADF